MHGSFIRGSLNCACAPATQGRDPVLSPVTAGAGRQALWALISGLSAPMGWRCRSPAWPLGEEVSGAGQIQARDSQPSLSPPSLLSGVKWRRVSVEMGGKSGLSHEREEFFTSSRRSQRGHITQYFGRPCAMRNHSTQNARGTPLRNALRRPCICISPSQLYRIYELPSVQHDPGFM